MKVYVVTYETSWDRVSRVDRVILNEEHAKEYCRVQNLVEGGFYHEYEEFEVDET